MTLRGFSLPRSPEGRASLVPAPPWHYVGDFLVIEYWADPAAVAAVLPGRARAVPRRSRVAPRRCSSTGSRAPTDGDELVDPARSQYKEFFLVVNALLDGEHVTTCPLHLGRSRLRAREGLGPGLPEEARLDLDHAHVRRRVQGRSGCARRGRLRRDVCGVRPATRGGHGHAASVLSETGPTHNDPPLVNVRHFPRLAAGRHDDPAVHELVRARSRDRAVSEIWEGTPRSSSTTRRTRSMRRSHPCAWARASASPSPTPWTTSRPSASSAADGRGDASRASASRRSTSSAGSASRATSTLRGHSRPIDGTVLGEVARGGEREAELAVAAAASAAFPAWAALGPVGRAAYLHRLADLIDANVDRSPRSSASTWRCCCAR